MSTIFIKPEDMKKVFYDILIKCHLEESHAHLIADIFTNNSIDGVYSHGVNRFKQFVTDINNGLIKKECNLQLIKKISGLEQWNGNYGPGPYNAYHCTIRAMELAKLHGIGCVTLAKTTHWMRAGYYGWQAALKGFAFIAWTNTVALMPSWKSKNSKLGNNPIVFAAPYKKEAIVLDIAMSQFSFGLMNTYKLENKILPIEGGFDEQGNLTNDPEKILISKRPLPIGYWKGAGMSFLLDVLSTILSGGLSTSDITKSGNEHGCSQVFIAINLAKLSNNHSINNTIRNIIMDYKQSVSDNGNDIIYPGERVIKIRKNNLINGIPVNQKIWDHVKELY